MSYRTKGRLANVILYFMLIICCAVVLYPIFLMIITAFKSNLEVMKNPFSLPETWGFESFKKVLETSNYVRFYANSIFVTGTSLLIIIITATLASFPLARYKFRLNTPIFLFFIFGVMIPIRLAVVELFRILDALGLYDNLWALIGIYSAMGIPFSILIIVGFMKGIPNELAEAAKLDGCNDFRLLLTIFVPLIRPAIATAAIYNFIPIWNDFFFPLIFLKSEELKTVPLGTAIFFGQYQTEWPVVFAALTLAVVPPLLLYLALSQQFIKGLTAGAVKG